MGPKVLVAIALSFCAVPATAAPILSIQPTSRTVVVGQAISVDMFVFNSADLYAFQFDLGFDPTVLTAIAVTEGPFLGSGGSTFFLPGAIDNTGGVISFTANSLLTAISGVNGNGFLATAQFTAVAAGSSPINLFNVMLLDSSLSLISTTTLNGTVTVTSATSVPEPSAAILFATGLICILCRLVTPVPPKGSPPI